MSVTEDNKRMWDAIPFDERVLIDVAIDRGDKPEAAKRCAYAKTGFTFDSARTFVQKRSVELAKRQIQE